MILASLASEPIPPCLPACPAIFEERSLFSASWPELAFVGLVLLRLSYRQVPRKGLVLLLTEQCLARDIRGRRSALVLPARDACCRSCVALSCSVNCFLSMMMLLLLLLPSYWWLHRRRDDHLLTRICLA